MAIRPNALPAASSVSGSDALIVDRGSAVEKATPAQIIDAAIPLATQEEAETGSNNTKRVTPLRVKQAIDALGVSAENLASTDPGKGAALVGTEDGSTVQAELNGAQSSLAALGFNGEIPRAFFGIHFSKAADSFGVDQTPYHDFGQGSVRLWDSSVTWRLIEPTKGAFTWTIFDDIVNKAVSADCEVLYVLGQPPVWATGGSAGGFGVSNTAYNSKPPTTDQDWIDYITAVATRYAGKITAYEVWNEVNYGEFYSGTVSRLAELQELAYDTIKAIDPDALVLSPSMFLFAGSASQTPGDEYLTSFLGEGAGAHFEALAIHPYAYPGEPEDMVDHARQFRAVLAAHSLDVPIWSTEWTWHSWRDATRTFREAPTYTMSDEQAVSYLVRGYLASIEAGFERSFFYGMDYPWSGLRLIDLASKSTVLAGGLAYQFLTDTFVGARMVDRVVDRRGSLAAMLIKNDRERFSVRWCRDHHEITLRATDLNLTYLREMNGGSYDTVVAPDNTYRLSSPVFCGHTPVTATQPAASSATLDRAAWDVLDNGDFVRRLSTGIPSGWSTPGPAGATVASYAGTDAADHPNAVTFTPDTQYQQLAQVLNRPLTPGLYRLHFLYMTAAGESDPLLRYSVSFETPDGQSGPPFSPLFNLQAVDDWTLIERLIVVKPGEYPGPVKLGFVHAGASGFDPLHLDGVHLDLLNDEPEQREPYTHGVYHLASLSQANGDFVAGDRIVLTTAAGITAAGATMLTVTTGGTFGTLPALTADTTATAREIEVSVENALKIGQWISLNGSNLYRVVQQTAANRYRLNAAISGSPLSGATVAFAAPVLKRTAFAPLSGGNYEFSEPVKVDALAFDLTGVPNFADDSAAASGGVAVGGVYRNGSILMVRAA